MKARVKGTTDIIEMEFDKDALNACYPPYHDKEHDMYYQPEQLEWVDNEVNAEPDYWTRLEHQAVINIYCAYVENNGCKWSLDQAIQEASALIEKLKEEK